MELKENKLSYTEELVLNLIPRKKPLTTKDVVNRKVINKITGIPIREISFIIEELRKKYPICSSRGQSGYWLGNKQEIEAFVKECRHHAEGLLDTANNLEQMIKESNVDEF